MIRPTVFAILLVGAACAHAYPMPEPQGPVLDKTDAESLRREWVVSPSFFVNQLQAIRQTPLVPAGVTPTAREEASLAESRSGSFGFQFDVNYNGRYELFLPLQPVPLLGDSFRRDRNDLSQPSNRLFALPLPGFEPAGAADGDYPLLVANFARTQNLHIVDAGALARGEPGWTGKAQWSAGASKPSEAESKPGKAVLRLVELNPLWLAVALGLAVLIWQWRIRPRLAR